MRDATDLPEEEFSRDREKHEIPFSDDATHIWEGVQWRPTQQEGRPRRQPSRRPVRPPETRAQALMETAPGHEPQQSAEELNVSRDRVAAAVDRLAPREQWVVEAHMWRGMTFQEIADVLGVSKAVAHRIYQSALGHLRVTLGSPAGEE